VPDENNGGSTNVGTAPTGVAAVANVVGPTRQREPSATFDTAMFVSLGG